MVPLSRCLISMLLYKSNGNTWKMLSALTVALRLFSLGSSVSPIGPFLSSYQVFRLSKDKEHVQIGPSPPLVYDNILRERQIFSTQYLRCIDGYPHLLFNCSQSNLTRLPLLKALAVPCFNIDVCCSAGETCRQR